MSVLEDFQRDTLIQCARCRRCALLKSSSYDHLARKWTAHGSCLRCGHTWQFHPGGYAINDPKPYRYLPLWLQTRCKDQVLWAFNGEHLAFIEGYVAQTLRKRPLNHNSSLQSRLPKWILSAKNRDSVLRAIGRLKRKLAAA